VKILQLIYESFDSLLGFFGAGVREVNPTIDQKFPYYRKLFADSLNQSSTGAEPEQYERFTLSDKKTIMDKTHDFVAENIFHD